MKKTLLFVVAVFAFFLSSQAIGKAKHVVLVGLDGWGAYSVAKAEIGCLYEWNGIKYLIDNWP